jgi:hypothetical protein
VVADGRGAAARPRARWLWLPGPDGAVASVAAGIGGLGIGGLGAGWDGETGEVIAPWRGMSAG